MSTKNELSVNQTQFSFEEPFFEDITVPVGPKHEVVEGPSKKSNKKLMLIIGFVGFLILILGLVVIFSLSKGEQTEQLQEEELIEQKTTTNPFQERITRAREELEDADPTKQDLSYPPIDMELRLDPKPRR